MASPAEEQIVSNYETLLEFLQAMDLFLQDPDANIAPVFKDYITEVGYADILTLVKSRVMENPAFSTGRAQDEIFRIEALLRENLMRDFSKKDYYANAAAGLERERSYLNKEKTRTVKYMQGKMSIQGGS